MILGPQPDQGLARGCSRAAGHERLDLHDVVGAGKRSERCRNAAQDEGELEPRLVGELAPRGPGDPHPRRFNAFRHQRHEGRRSAPHRKEHLVEAFVEAPFGKAADGRATKIIIPSEIQGLAGLATGIKEVVGSNNAPQTKQ